MARMLTRKVQEIEGVAAGQTAIIKLPIGLSYHDLTIPYTGVTLAQMEEIRVVANGDVLERYKGANILDTFNQFDRMLAASGILRLNWERYGLITRQARQETILGTGLPSGDKDGQDTRKITNLRVEIDIASDASAPAINNVRAKMSSPRPSGMVKRLTRQTYEFGGSGEFEISDLKLVGGRVNRVHFMANNLDRLRLDLDGREVFDRRTEENELIQNDGIRTPQSGLWTIDTTEEGYGGDWIDVQGMQDVRFTLNMSAAETFAIYTETIDRVRS